MMCLHPSKGSTTVMTYKLPVGEQVQVSLHPSKGSTTVMTPVCPSVQIGPCLGHMARFWGVFFELPWVRKLIAFFCIFDPFVALPDPAKTTNCCQNDVNSWQNLRFRRSGKVCASDCASKTT